MKRAAIERPVPFLQRRKIYFDAPEEPAPEPMPVEPAPEEPLPSAPLPEPLLGEEPIEDPVDPPDDEDPLAAPCSRRQRSFSRPVRLAHCVPLPSEGEVLDGEPVVLGEELDEPVEPPAEEPVLPDPPTLCDDDWATAAAEKANSAATVAAERTFSIWFS